MRWHGPPRRPCLGPSGQRGEGALYEPLRFCSDSLNSHRGRLSEHSDCEAGSDSWDVGDLAGLGLDVGAHQLHGDPVIARHHVFAHGGREGVLQALARLREGTDHAQGLWRFPWGLCPEGNLDPVALGIVGKDMVDGRHRHAPRHIHHGAGGDIASPAQAGLWASAGGGLRAITRISSAKGRRPLTSDCQSTRRGDRSWFAPGHGPLRSHDEWGAGQCSPPSGVVDGLTTVKL